MKRRATWIALGLVVLVCLLANRLSQRRSLAGSQPTTPVVSPATSKSAQPEPPARIRVTLKAEAQPQAPTPPPRELERFARGASAADEPKAAEKLTPPSPPLPVLAKPTPAKDQTPPSEAVPTPKVEPPVPAKSKQVIAEVIPHQTAKPPLQIASSPPPAAVETQAADARPSPAPQPSAAASGVAYHGAPREVGRALLGVDGKKEGTLPMLTLDYRQTLGWQKYAELMRRLGGEFVLFNPVREQIVAKLNPATGSITKVAKGDLYGFSPRLREVPDEPALAACLAQIPGRENLVVVLLVPLHVDFVVFGGLAQALAARSVDIKALARVAGRYERKGQTVLLRTTEVVFRDGRRQPVDLEVELARNMKPL